MADALRFTAIRPTEDLIRYAESRGELVEMWLAFAQANKERALAVLRAERPRWEDAYARGLIVSRSSRGSEP